MFGWIDYTEKHHEFANTERCSSRLYYELINFYSNMLEKNFKQKHFKKSVSYKIPTSYNGKFFITKC